MRRYNRCFILILLCCAMWCILAGNFHIGTVLAGLVCGSAVVFITHRFILLPEDRPHRAISPLNMLRYVPYLIFSIYRAGFALIPKMLTGRCRFGVYRIGTALAGPLSRAVLANSITMTPGTMTVDEQDGALTVLWLQADTRDPGEAARRIAGGFERILLGRGREL